MRIEQIEMLLWMKDNMVVNLIMMYYATEETFIYLVYSRGFKYTYTKVCRIVSKRIFMLENLNNLDAFINHATMIRVRVCGPNTINNQLIQLNEFSDRHFTTTRNARARLKRRPRALFNHHYHRDGPSDVCARPISHRVPRLMVATCKNEPIWSETKEYIYIGREDRRI